MEQSGYITIHWKKIERDITKTFDMNGDGEVDKHDAHVILQRSIKYLTHHTAIPVGSFAGGLALGFRSR
jgi:hypothetical protein